MQKRDFIDAFKDPAKYPVGVINPKDSTRYIPNSKWYWDPNLRKNSAFIREVNGKKEYWIDVSKSSYRKWFKKFIEREYGVAFNSVPPLLQADHVLSRTYAKEAGIRFVRMALVWNRYNTYAGWCTEKGFIEYARNNIGIKSMYILDYSIIMKLLSISPPKNITDFKNRGITIATQMSNRAKLEPPEILLKYLNEFFGESWWPVLPDQPRT